MKRHLPILLLALAVLPLGGFRGGSLAAQTVSDEPVQDAMYVYRNDGKFHGFYNFEVLRVGFSKTDTLGREHLDYVVQEIETLDSLYRIPISAIDSVSFITPRTEYADGVKATTTSHLWDYVVASDSMTQFTLSASTPASLIPAVGDRLCTTKSRDYLPGGFYGTVQSVSTSAAGTLVQCRREDFNAYLKRHMFKGGLNINEDQQRAARRRALARRVGHDSGEAVLKATLDTIKGEGSYDAEIFKINDDWSIKGEGSFEFAIVPTIYATAFGSFDLASGLNMSCALYVNADISFDLAVKAAIEGSLDFPVAKHIVWIPDTPFFITSEAGFNTSISGELEFKYHEGDTISAHMQAQLNKSLYTDNLMVHGNAKLLGHSNKMEAAGTVTITAGPYYKVNFLLGTEDIGKLELRVDAGLKTSLEAEIKMKELEKPVDSISTAVYDLLNRDNTVKTGTFAKVGWAAKFYHWEDDDTFWEKDRAWDFQGALVPKFQELNGYYDSSSRRLSLNCNVDRNVFVFTTGTLGFALFDEKGKQVGDRLWDKRTYFRPEDWNRYSLTFNDVEPDKWYTVHPLCHLMGYELIASPGKRFYSGVQDLIVDPLELQFDHQGGTGAITVKNTLTKKTEVGVSYSNWQDTDWLTYEAAKDAYNITVKPNTGYKRRLAQIEFVARDPNDTFGFSSRRQTVYVRQEVDPAYLGLLLQQISNISNCWTDYEGESIWVHGSPNPEDEDYTELFGRSLMPHSEDVDAAFNSNPVIQKNDDGTFTLQGEGLTITGKFDPVEPGQPYRSGSGTFTLNTDMDHHRKSAADVETVYRYNGVPNSAFGLKGAGEILDELTNTALDEHYKRDIEGDVTVTWNESKQQYEFKFVGAGTLTYSATCYTRLSGITAENGFDWYKPYPNATIIETKDYTINCGTDMEYRVFYELNE